jgi:4-hydroxy-3-polyprenylbenzoate decarboxylase
MAFDDLRDWIDHLRREGELAEVTAEVDPNLEIAEITDRVTKAGGPALYFTNVRGSRMPLLINQFGTERRTCMAFGVESLDELGQKVSDVLEMQPPEGLMDKVRALGRLKSIADSRPKSVSSGPCQEVVLDPPSLASLPVMTCWPGDGGPYITLPAVITKDPRTGTRNVGMYRVQVFDETTTAMHWQIHKDAAADWRGMGERMDVAIVLGVDPITAYTASAPLPKHIDELMLAGFLRGKPVELVKCRTVDLEVPARAEIVIEGYIAKGELRDEGPFGDHTGYYTPTEPFPVVHVTAVTTRRDPVYPSIVVGVPPQEDAWLGKVTERLFLPAVRMTMPEVVDYDLPIAGAFHNLCIVSIRKAYPGHARKVMHAIWGTGLLALTKGIVVVDADVDVHDYGEVMWQVGANVDPARDVVLADGPLDHLDHAPTLQFHGGKLGIDATAKGPAEGYTRGWPDRIRMTDDVRERVTSRWGDYGIDVAPGSAAGPPQTGKMRRFARSGRRDG